MCSVSSIAAVMKSLWSFGLLAWALLPRPVAAEPPSSVRSLEQAVQLTLARNPGLKGLLEDVGAQEALITQADLIPNPELNLTAEQLGEKQDGVSPAQGEIRVSQRIERGGKRQARVNVASVEKEQTRIDSAIGAIELIGELKKTWAQLQYLIGEKELQERQLQVSSELVSAVRRRVEAGGTLSAELTKAQTSRASDEIEAKRIEREMASTRQAIAAFWGGSPEEVSLSGARDSKKDSAAALPPSTNDGTLRIHALNLGVELAERTLELQRAKGVQDVTVGAGYQRLSGIKDDALLVSLTVPLPLSDRNQGAIQSAARLLASAKQKVANERLKLDSRIRTLSSSLRSLDFEIQQLAGSVIPQAERSFSDLEGAYRVGKASFIDVVDSQRMLLSARRRKLEAERSRYEMQAELEVLTARDPLSTER